jgi:hypothetical protein
MPKHFLDSINIAAPCSAAWDEMIGNEQVRFCQQCSLHVHDLSRITRKDAVRLVAASKGKLCVRYCRRADGTAQTADHARPLSQIKRRLSRIAAGAFSATLSLASTAVAQSRQPLERDPQVVIEPANKEDRAEPADSEGQTASLTGTIIDPNEAVVNGAKVTLVNTETGREESVESNDEGVYRFETLETGIYSLKIESPGFMVFERPAVEIKSGMERRLDATLEIGAVLGGAIVIMPSTPLIRAIWNEEDEKLTEVRSLLAAGVDVNALDENIDSTALFAAVSRGKLELVQLLLFAGADPNVRNSSGQTALMSLDEDSTAEIAWALINLGAKVNLKDKEGESALMVVAALEEKKDVLQALLDAGARVNAKDREGKTALMRAAEKGYMENVKALLLAGADVHKKDNEGRTALRYAQNEGEGSVIEVLASYGAFE